MARQQAHPKKTGDRSRSARPPALSVVLVVLAAVLPNLPGLNAPFMLDDRFRIEHNPEIRSPAAWWNSLARQPTDGTPHRNDPSRPLTSFTFMLNAAATGVRPGAFRAVNIALHALTAVLLLLLARRICTTLLPARVAVTVAAGVTVLWASHPVHAATVTYLSGRAEILAAAGMFGTVLLFFGGRFGWALAVCALALLAKPNAAAAPLLLLAADCAAGCGSWRTVRWSQHAPFWALVIAYVFARRLLLGAVGDIEGGSGVMPVPEYLAAMPHALATYLRLLVVPVGLSLDHVVFRPSEAGWPMVASPAILLCTLGAVVWAVFRHRPEGRTVLFGAVWFLVVLLPTSSVLPTVNPVVETRLYPAAFGVLLAVAAAVFVAYDRLRISAHVYRVTIASVCCALASLTGARAALMAQPERHWRTTLVINPSSMRAHNELGMHYAGQGRYGDAADAFRAILSEHRDNAEARANLGAVLAAQGRIAEARGIFGEVLRREPVHPLALHNAARLALQEGDAAEAERLLYALLSVEPANPDAHLLLGAALLTRGDAEGAERYFLRALSLDPRSAPAAYNLGFLYEMTGRAEAARKSYLRALRADPRHASAAARLQALDGTR